MDELIEEFRALRDQQLRHFEGLDSKAGILLGFAGAIATLAPGRGGLALAGRTFAILSALLALASFTPRRFPSIATSRLSRALERDDKIERQHALAALLERSIVRADRIVEWKARTLVGALLAIVLATALLGAAIMAAGA